ncbi:hypothetical protein SDC9_112503 [bioreactor metagenome]|uniref:Uncharacterized protein n=1 Tax=bioreactor metagenome TaxID=1076179 RepID=A0A645BK48_9ZZZZ
MIGDVESCSVSFSLEAGTDVRQIQILFRCAYMPVDNDNGYARSFCFQQNSIPTILHDRREDNHIYFIGNEGAHVLDLAVLVHEAVPVQHFVAFFIQFFSY